MKLRKAIVATSAAGVILVTSSVALAQKPEPPAANTGYAPVNGLNLYYEAYGTGVAPLILLHGGVVGISMFGANIDAFAANRPVIAVDFQGHAHTKDIDRPLKFESLADDIAALMAYLKIPRADVLSYSLGGGVALQLATRFPELIRKLVVVSAPFARNGFYPGVLADMDKMGPASAAMIQQSPLAKAFPDVNWAVLFTKLGNLLRQDYDWSREVAALKPQTLLVFADADAIRPAHIVEFYGLLGGGQHDAGFDGSARPAAQLAVLPSLTHYNISASPPLVAAVNPFLDAPFAVVR